MISIRIFLWVYAFALPEITDVVARQFPNSELVQGDTFSVDLNNVWPTVPNDVGMDL